MYPYITRRNSLLVRFLCHPAVSLLGRHFYFIEAVRVQYDTTTYVKIQLL